MKGEATAEQPMREVHRQAFRKWDADVHYFETSHADAGDWYAEVRTDPEDEDPNRVLLAVRLVHGPYRTEHETQFDCTRDSVADLGKAIVALAESLQVCHRPPRG
jgi:hypothetical protein